MTIGEQKQYILASSSMTDMEKLAKIFELCKKDLKGQEPELYYAILAVLDKEKKPDASEYWR